jgi:hypothetical protein
MNTDELLKAMDAMAAAPPRKIEIKGLGIVHIRDITIGEVDEQIADEADTQKKRGAARGACRLLCDESGKRLLDPDNAEHVKKMAKLPVRVLIAINEAGAAPGN